MTTEPEAPAADEDLRALVTSLQDKMVQGRLSFHGFCGQYGSLANIAENLVRVGLRRRCLRMGTPEWIDIRARPDQETLDWAKAHFLDEMAEKAVDAPDSPPRHMAGWSDAEWAFAKGLFLETLADCRKERDTVAARGRLLKNPVIQSALLLAVAYAIHLAMG